MGGYGSGRQWGASVVEDATVLDIDRLRQMGFLAPHLWHSNSLIWSNIRTGEKANSISYELHTDATVGWMRLHYTIYNHNSGDPFPVDYRVELVSTRPHYGGVRWWFVCPLSGRRVRKLYLSRGCDYFASRQALGLTYQSCRESPGDRAMRKTRKILIGLGGTGDTAEIGLIPKPRGMHWETYSRRSLEAREALEYSSRCWFLEVAPLLGYPSVNELQERREVL